MQSSVIISPAGVMSRFALLLLIVLILGLPINDFWRFLILIVAVMAVCFGSVRLDPIRWLGAVTVVLAISAVDWLFPGPQIQEGHNVYIPVGASLEVFERELPVDAQSTMLQRFKGAYLDDKVQLPGAPTWWQEPEFQRPGFLIDHAFARSSDALLQRPKYSRIVEAVNFRSQNEARLDVFNLSQFRFYPKKARHPHNFFSDARIDRDSLPFFVMVEINPALIEGELCWQGEVLWEREAGQFSSQRNHKFDCENIQESQLGKRVFALAITPNAPYAFEVRPNLQERAILWIKLLLRSVAAFGVLGCLLVFYQPIRLLLPLGAALGTLLAARIYWPDLVSGFRTHKGGTDGLTHKSFGFEISQALAKGDLSEALRGGEAIFFYMPGLRYFRAAEDFLFGSTAFGIVLVTIFIPIFLFLLLRRLLPLRWCVALIVAFLFIPIFARLGFAQFLYVSPMWKGFPEPLGYGAFLGALALIAWTISAEYRTDYNSLLPPFFIGLALAISVAMRPNLAIAAALVMIMLGIWLLVERRLASLAALAIGFCPILLIPIHNWYFGRQFVLLTSAAFIPQNLATAPSTYLAALTEALQQDWAGENLVRVYKQLRTWINLSDLYRVPILLVCVWVLGSRLFKVHIKALALLAVSLQLPLLFYRPEGRYSLLAWLLTFLVFLVAMRERIVPYLARMFPKAADRMAGFPVSLRW